MLLKRTVLLFAAIFVSLAISPTYAGDIVSCDSFENCADGSAPLTNTLLALEAKLDALEQEINEPEEDWTTPVFEGGWGAYGDLSFFGSPGYYKDKQGIVHLRGQAGGGSCSQPLFTLPLDYRPPYVVLSTVYGAAGAARVDIGPDGTVRMLSNCSTVWVSLWNISFRTF